VRVEFPMVAVFVVVPTNGYHNWGKNAR